MRSGSDHEQPLRREQPVQRLEGHLGVKQWWGVGGGGVRWSKQEAPSRRRVKSDHCPPFMFTIVLRSWRVKGMAPVS